MYNEVIEIYKENILYQLILKNEFIKEEEYYEIINNMYKLKCFVVKEYPTYQEYIEIFKYWYKDLIDDYYKVAIGKNNITRFLEKEPKDKTYKVEEIIEKLKEFDLYDGWKGFNGK